MTLRVRRPISRGLTMAGTRKTPPGGPRFVRAPGGPTFEIGARSPEGGLVFGSVCSGIGAPELAWHPLGWRSAFMSEIDPFPRAVLAHHHPEVPLHGDFTTIKAGRYAAIDVLVGGTPCQSFSVAGLRGGMADERGNLALEFLRLADRLRPRWVVWENVPGVRSTGAGRDLGAFLGGLGELGYGWAYASLDAQYRGLAQRRERVFVVGHLGDWRYPAAVLFEPACMRGDSPPSRQAGKGVASTLEASLGRRCGQPNDHDPAGQLIIGLAPTIQATDNLITATLDANYGRLQGCSGQDLNHGHSLLVPFGGGRQTGPLSVSATLTAHGSSTGRHDFESETFLVAHSLRADGFDASEDGTGRGTPLVPVAFNSREDPCCTGDVAGSLGSSSPQAQAVACGMGVRRLTPRECERLQGFPDDFTLIPYRGKPAKDGPRYKALGNSMAVPVMKWIGERISRFDAESAQARHAA